MDLNKLTQKSQAALSEAQSRALKLGHQQVTRSTFSERSSSSTRASCRGCSRRWTWRSSP